MIVYEKKPAYMQKALVACIAYVTELIDRQYEPKITNFVNWDFRTHQGKYFEVSHTKIPL